MWHELADGDPIAEEKEQFIFVKENLNKPQAFWNIVLWTNETKVELFVNALKQYVWVKPLQKRTPYQQSSMVEDP